MAVIIKNGKTYGDRSVSLTQAEYNALSETEKNNGTVYYIYDANAVPQASDVVYDNTESGLNASNVQGALDELSTGLTTQTGTFTKVNSKISSVEFARYVKWGKVCVANVNFTVGTAITNSTETLFTGLPAAVVQKRFFAMQVQSKTGVYARLEVNTAGEIRNAYTNGNISTGQYEGVITYITRD